MNLRPATLSDVRQLMTWFPDHQSLVNWGGPFQQWPIEEQRFLEAMHWGQMSARAADDDFSQLLAFGQFYEREHRCHLAFLAVAGSQRGKGLGQVFINELMKEALLEIPADEYSLFVMAHNVAAVNCYRALGFNSAPYPPDAVEINDCLFMTRAVDLKHAGRKSPLLGRET